MNELQIVACADNRIHLGLCIMLFSALKELSADSHPHFHVLDDGLSDESKQHIRASLDTLSRPYELTFIPLSDSQMKQFIGGSYLNDKPSWISRATYARLLIDEILPELEHCIYIDSDIVVQLDVAELAKIELGDACLGAVKDERAVPNGEGITGLNGYEAYNIPGDADMFNAGFLILNLKAWRAQSIREQAFEYLKKYDCGGVDQAALNAVCYGKVHWLDAKWNAQLGNRTEMPPEKSILHYTGRDKPWVNECPPKYAQPFFKLLDQTTYANWRPPFDWGKTWLLSLGRKLKYAFKG